MVCTTNVEHKCIYDGGSSSIHAFLTDGVYTTTDGKECTFSNGRPCRGMPSSSMHLQESGLMTSPTSHAQAWAASGQINSQQVDVPNTPHARKEQLRHKNNTNLAKTSCTHNL